ncbi:MAG: M43 family zinc metalloprotease [Bacteroidia bacterium]|nr:M43 family zinc metalloprotease [Bacteroidia bacterium]
MRHQLLRFFLAIAVFAVGHSINLSGQNIRPMCGTDEYYQIQAQKDPQFLQRRAELKRFIADQIAKGGNSARGTVYEIPVVVHVVYNTPNQNVPDAQVQSQIDVLNEDFRRLNADTVNTPAPFKPVAGDAEIEFCLAAFDPAGNSTNGIVRVSTSKTVFANGDDIKSAATGGSDPWDQTQYLNIWVGPLSGGLLGFASPPGGSGSGVVIGPEYFGRVGANLDPAFDLGRTATHEIGHWLSLDHTWAGGGCSSNDGIADTPVQDQPNFGCQTFPSISCPAEVNGDMFMNYMDYSDDDCFNLFTKGQSTAMRAMFATGGPLESFLTSGGCQKAGFDDIGVETILDPNGDQCGGKSRGEIVLRNYGQNVINSAEIRYKLDGNLLAINFWSGTLNPGASQLVTFPSFNVSIGIHNFEVYSAKPNGSADSDPTNDTATSTFEALNNAGLVIPYFEGFESGVFPPQDWQLNNSDNQTSWQPAPIGRNGSGSAFMDNYNYSAFGQVDELLTPGLDLTPFEKVGLSFHVSYARYAANSGFSDTLEVWASGDCGKNFQLLWRKYGNDLATSPATTSSFVPLSAAQWRQEWVDLTDFSDSTYVVIKFRHITNYENNLYLDNININEIFSLDIEGPLQTGNLTLTPNPAKDKVTLTYEALKGGETQVSLIDISGRELFRESFNALIGVNHFPISLTSLAAGIYFVRLRQETGEVVKKLSVE